MTSGKVLLIDDEELMCDLIKQALKIRGYTVTTVTNSADAHEEISRRHDYDVIITDLRTHKVSTIELITTSNNQNMDYQFIVITGLHDKLALKDLQPFKPSGFIERPFDISTLVSTIELAFENKKTLDRGQRLTIEHPPQDAA